LKRKKKRKKVIDRELQTESYNYSFDESLIASHPLYPKESAKLMVYKRATGEVIHTTFGELLNYIPEETAFLFNNTRVIKARVFGKKRSGGKVELLLNRPVGDNRYSVFIRGKVKVGTVLEFDGFSCQIEKLSEDGSREVSFNISFSELLEKLEKVGHIPLPPYIKREDESIDEVDYQTVFAKESGAVAAPTASLHFSEEMLQKVEKNYQTEYLTLHIGAGTFKPVEVEDIANHPMHSEIYNIGESAKSLIDSEKNVLAVGTTVTRTVEHYWRTGRVSGEADIFLHPKSLPHRVDYLLTNFHLPKSTLLMLVASFIGLDETLRIYNIAVEKRYRFFSYGDAMLIV
jgi:S-adenosylmethionine:tRNA ribosyltransferase-isomerase